MNPKTKIARAKILTDEEKKRLTKVFDTPVFGDDEFDCVVERTDYKEGKNSQSYVDALYSMQELNKLEPVSKP